MKRLINIDWLTLYCQSSKAFDHIKGLTEAGYTVTARSQETRHFSKHYDVYKADDSPYLEIQECPKSLKVHGGIWVDNAMLIKVYNRHLYFENTIQELTQLLNYLGIKIKSISRCDLCMDFNYFDNHMHPHTLIRKYFADKVWFIGNKKFYSIGKQYDTIQYDYLRFGSGKSSYSTYLYNKTKELREKKDKPYIRELWDLIELNVKDVWRLEISLKTDAKHLLKIDDEIIVSGGVLVNKTTGEVFPKDHPVIKGRDDKLFPAIPITIDDLMTKEAIMSLFDKLVSYCFRFRIKEPGKKKLKCEKVELINVSDKDFNYRPTRLTAAKGSGRTEKLVNNYLEKLVESHPELLSHVYEIRLAMVADTGLEHRHD